jgi:hypothetical protein
MKWFETDI